MNVVYLHAFPFDERMWEPETGPHLYSLGSTMAEWAQAILESNTEPFVAVGASMGGYCAYELAKAAYLVEALVVVGARADPDTPERKQARDATIGKLREEGVEAVWEEMRQRLLSENASADALERARSIALDLEAEELVRGVAAMRDRKDSTELVSQFQGPLLVALGDGDPFFSVEEARSLADRASRGRLHVFEGCGHLPPLEQPEAFRRVLDEFLAGV